MNRSSFLKGLLAVGGLTIVPFNPPKRYQKIHLLQIFVAGFRFYKGKALIKSMQPGDRLELKREPDNKHDDAAIALWYKGQKVGYVPSDHNFTLCRLMDGNLMDLKAEITHVKPEAADWEKLCVLIYTLKEEKALPPYAGYLTTVYTPEYRSLKRKVTPKKDWYQILEEKSRTNNVYNLIHLHLRPEDVVPNHEGDFVAINKKTLPNNKAVQGILDKIDAAISDINHAFDDDGIVVLKTEQLTEFLEAGYELHPLIDKLGRKFLELKFDFT